MPRKLALAAGFCLIGLIASAAFAEAAQTQGQIAAQPLAGALKEFAARTGLQVVYGAELARGMESKGSPAGLSVDDTLRELLRGTGLEFEFVAERTVAIREKRGAEERNSTDMSKSASRMAQVNATSDGKSVDSTTDPEEKHNGQESANTSKGLKVEEIVVTAQKREERLQDVPVAVTAIGADSLFDNNQLRLQDYYTKVPGLNLVTAVRGESQIAIRGIMAATGTNPTVGVTVDDVPYGSSVLWGNGSSTPDLDPSDLMRIEVLRGPQGTLYGANSAGGLLKFVTVDPSTDGMRGRLEAGVNGVHNADDLGYSARGSFNLPLTETFAVRMSGFIRRAPGYIDNPVNGTHGVNRMDVDGGRLSALWRPAKDVSLKLSGLIQDSRRHATSTVNLSPILGDLQQNALPDTGRFDRTFEIYSAILKMSLGSIDLTSVSGYNVNKIDALIQAGTVPTYENTRTRKLSQELRLSGPLWEQAEWLLGGFYTREKNHSTQERAFLTAGVPNPPTGEPDGNRLFIVFPTSYSEYAVFADVTYRFTDRFDVQVGGRQSRNEQTYERTAIGADAIAIYGQPSPVVTSRRRQNDSSFTYLLTPRFTVTPNLMTYARLASGYRPGSNNTGLPTVPTTYQADTTLNYEIGAKGSVLDRRLHFDVSMYHIDWKDIQITVVPVGTATSYVANVGKAKSQGVELSMQLRLLDSLAISAWGAYNNAELTENFPTTLTASGGAGQRLPFSAPWSGNLSIDQDFPLTSRVNGFVGGSLSYIGDRQGTFVSGATRRQNFPSYAQLDLRAGLEFDSWRVNLYANNVADKRGAITGDPTIVPSGIVYIQPRTVGLSLTREFR